jgi:hypothetical protein
MEPGKSVHEPEVDAQFLRHFRLERIDSGTATQLAAHYAG